MTIVKPLPSVISFQFLTPCHLHMLSSIILGDNCRGLAISRNDHHKTVSSVDDVQCFSSINLHDGTVVNNAIMQWNNL